MSGPIMKRLFANILSDDLAASRDFYIGFLGLKSLYDSDWFINLATDGEPRFELGILKRDTELLGQADRRSPQGFMLTVVVEDVETVFEAAKARNLTIVEPPRDLFYGQRRLLLRDPNGVLVDISSPSR